MSDHFEDALEQTAGGLERSIARTVSIRATSSPGFRSARPGSSAARIDLRAARPRMRPEFTVVRRAVLIAAVVAVSIFGHLQGGPSYRTREPGTASLPAAAARRQRDAPERRPAQPRRSDGLGLRRNACRSFSRRSVAFGGWSPRGSRYAVGEAIGDGKPTWPPVRRSGREVDSFEAEDFAG